MAHAQQKVDDASNWLSFVEEVAAHPIFLRQFVGPIWHERFLRMKTPLSISGRRISLAFETWTKICEDRVGFWKNQLLVLHESED